MTLNTTASLSADIVFQQQEIDNNSVDNRQGSVGYSQSLTSGKGSLQINSVYNVQSVQIAPSSSYSLDFSSLSQPIMGGYMTISFNNIKSICVSNLSTTTGEDLSVRATGSNTLTSPFNGGSGNILVKPAAAYVYSDPYAGSTVDGSNKNFQIYNNGIGTGTFTLVVVGTTGTSGSSVNSLFEVGDCVNLTAYTVSGYENTLGGFSGAFEIDFTQSGSVGNHSSTEPFSTGCPSDTSFCEWTFSKTGGGFGPQLGYWALSDSGTCCDCSATLPTLGLQPDGTYIEENGVGVYFDCNTATSGCNILNKGWKIIDKQYGDASSTPESLDDTWGYSVQFTGYPSSSGVCVGTGFAPSIAASWIPETYFTSGTGCI
tara:strand:+ start:1148 stop:2263 length:1116 start_codon:yes stop_codon:yes gene_type:complete